MPWIRRSCGNWRLNIPDFTRYAKSQRSQALGQALGLPATMTAFAFIGVAVTSATVVIYGEAIWDPVALIARIGNPLVIIFGALIILIAQLTTNMAANVVSPANDFSSLAPRRISYVAGGLITACIGIVMMPWKLYADAAAYIFTWLVGYSSLMGAIGGILIADYWIIRGRTLDLPELFKPARPLHLHQRRQLARDRGAGAGDPAGGARIPAGRDDSGRPGPGSDVPRRHLYLCLVRDVRAQLRPLPADRRRPPRRGGASDARRALIVASISGKVALVTGSTSGIGMGIVEHLASLGAQVVVHGRDQARAPASPSGCGARGTPPRRSSAISPRWMPAAASCGSRSSGSAGSTCWSTTPRTRRRGYLEDVPVELWDAIMHVNLRAPFLLLQEAVEVDEDARRRIDRQHRLGQRLHRRAQARPVLGVEGRD